MYASCCVIWKLIFYIIIMFLQVLTKLWIGRPVNSVFKIIIIFEQVKQTQTISIIYTLSLSLWVVMMTTRSFIALNDNIFSRQLFSVSGNWHDTFNEVRFFPVMKEKKICYCKIFWLENEILIYCCSAASRQVLSIVGKL